MEHMMHISVAVGQVFSRKNSQTENQFLDRNLIFDEETDSKQKNGGFMANALPELRSWLKDVMLVGTGTIDKRKLLWMLGWAQDRPGAWADLLTTWADIGGGNTALTGIEAGNLIVLFSNNENAVEKVKTWAKS